MDEMRAQLSMLMGSISSKQQDDKSKAESPSSSHRFRKENICKLYLTGLCPHELFANTKHYLGPCEKEHSDDLRELYLKVRKQKRYYYEEEAIRAIRPLVDDADRKISRGQIRCEEDEKKGVVDEKDEELKKTEEKIEETMKLAEKLGNEGKVDDSMRLMEECEKLNQEKLKYREKQSENESTFNQKLKPCDICGALLSATDSDRRLSEHFSGKIHIGFQMLRNALKELREYISNAPNEDGRVENTREEKHRSIEGRRGSRDTFKNARESTESYSDSKHKRYPRERDSSSHERHRRYNDGGVNRYETNAVSPSRRSKYEEFGRNRKEQHYNRSTERVQHKSGCLNHRKDYYNEQRVEGRDRIASHVIDDSDGRDSHRDRHYRKRRHKSNRDYTDRDGSRASNDNYTSRKGSGGRVTSHPREESIRKAYHYSDEDELSKRDSESPAQRMSSYGKKRKYSEDDFAVASFHASTKMINRKMCAKVEEEDLETKEGSDASPSVERLHYGNDLLDIATVTMKR